ncbi:MAG: VOC family protein [Armatimonadetes bacterium]|nr:VOC family protein [Armatimonadota bacterium]
MKILETVLYGENLAECLDFYSGILGLEVISYDEARDIFLKLDDSVLIIFKASKTLIPDAGVPPHGTTGQGHIAFRASHEELDAWEKKLNATGIKIIQSITWKNGAKSIYFNDPAGNILEFATPDLWF